MPTAEPQTLSGIQKAAILLTTLGDQAAAGLLRHLDQEHVHAVAAAIAKLPPVTSEQVVEVLEEFCRRTSHPSAAVRGGPEFSRRLLKEAFGSEEGQKILEKVPALAPEAPKQAGVLEQADPQQLARFLYTEHPQTIALVLAHLERKQAGELLATLPAPLRADVAVRMVNLDRISPDVVAKVAGAISRKMKNLRYSQRKSCGGVRAVSGILSGMESSAVTELLTDMESRDNQLASSIRDLMFTFEELLNVDTNGIREIVSNVDRKLLVTGLKGTGEDLRAHIMRAMSQRSAEILREDMDALGPVKISEVEAAQQQIIALARQLEQDGRLNLKGSSEEQYVD
ncbi:MAG: flagellar motor switch protein FliG [Acidobacteria bacterium]|nr:flagellar motor switch protein FliG [Acidobacteriota bacterium]